MSPRLIEAMDRVVSHGVTMLHRSIVDLSYEPGAMHFESDAAQLKQLIRERDDIALDESTLTPECIGQLMGGN